jgi:hypothetical protein
VQRVQVMAVGRGPGCSSPFHSLSHGLGQGWGGWGRQRECTRHGYRAWANMSSDAHSRTDFPWISLTTCSIKCPQEIKILIFEKFHLGWSLYWIRILKQFLLGQEVVFCFRANLNLGLSYDSDSNFGEILKEVRF